VKNSSKKGGNIDKINENSRKMGGGGIRKTR
jgi:hypothetical protein